MTSDDALGMGRDISRRDFVQGTLVGVGALAAGPAFAADALPLPPTSYPPAKGAAVTFSGVTVTGATDLKGMPGVPSKGTTDPAKLEFKDLVVGTGKAATASSMMPAC